MLSLHFTVYENFALCHPFSEKFIQPNQQGRSSFDSTFISLPSSVCSFERLSQQHPFVGIVDKLVVLLDTLIHR